MRLFRVVAFCVGVCALPAVAAPISGNVLQNPDAEFGNIGYWFGNASVDDGSFNRGINPHTGRYDFLGLAGAQSSLSQYVSVYGTSYIDTNLIDAGKVSANLSFWEQGLNQGSQSDDAAVDVVFYGATLQRLGSFGSGEIDSHDGLWQNYEGSALVPVGTRYLQYVMTFTRHQGTDLDAYIDDNDLFFSTGDVAPVAATPEPSAWALFGFGVLGVAGLARRRRA